MSRVLNCLLADCPYELYWFDKTKEGAMQLSYGLSGNSSEIFITSLTFSFKVAEAYKGADDYTTDISKTSAVTTAVANANAIVDKYAGNTDWEKLNAYRTEICRLVSYDRSAAEGGVAYGDPWQLVYVFDGDPNTNVVCEGYSKAFQYLCDLSAFGDVVCNTVTGTMNGGKGAGPHMWNIVEYYGKNYLVDITNCDDGTIGADTALFMVGTADKDDDRTYTFTVGSNTIVYEYDVDQSDLICEGYPALFDEEWGSGSSYEYKGSSLDKEYDGRPVKVMLSDIFATEDGTLVTDYPLSESGLYGKYCTAEWYQRGNGGALISATLENNEAIVGPSDPGSYRFVLRLAFYGQETREYIIIDFTISHDSHNYGTEWKYDGSNHWHECVCGEKTDITSHSFGNWSKADETQHKRTCECGAYETADHNWDEGVVTTEPTHLAEGQKTYTCADCGAKKYEEVPKTTTHSYGAWEKISETQHKRTCTCGAYETADHNLDAGVVTTEPTHLAVGQKTYTCEDCGATKTEEIAKLAEHIFETNWTYDENNHWHNCPCGEKGGLAAHSYGEDNICDTCGYESSVPHVHNMEFVAAKDATCTEDGNKAYYRCTECGKWFVDATGNTEITAQSEVILNALGHNTDGGWGHSDTEHWKICSRDGAKSDVSAHSYSVWEKISETQHKHICECGYEETADHSWNAGVVTTEPTHLAEGQKTYTCADCRAEKYEVISKLADHTFAAEWTYDENNHWHDCPCGEKSGLAAHSYGDWVEISETQHKRTCVCGAYETADHNWNAGVVTTDPTHLAEGQKTYTCADCGAKKTEEIAKLAEHTFAESWTYDENAHWHSCACGEKSGLAAHNFEETQGREVCKVCGYVVPGKVVSETKPENNALNADIKLKENEALDNIVLTQEEKERVQNGEDVNINLEVSDITESVPAEDKSKINTLIKDSSVGMYLDINLYKQIGTDSRQKITNTNSKLSITVSVPDSLISKSGVDYIYKVARIHNGEAILLDGVFDPVSKTFTFETDRFSTYALVYSENKSVVSGDNTVSAPTVSESPKMGDSRNPLPWIVILALSCAAVIGIVIFKKKGTR